jgi:hypothetical protein
MHSIPNANIAIIVLLRHHKGNLLTIAIAADKIAEPFIETRTTTMRSNE